jgi:hypothetical protein
VQANYLSAADGGITHDAALAARCERVIELRDGTVADDRLPGTAVPGRPPAAS